MKDEELYEDLPGGEVIQEELYDSIEPYQQEKLPAPPLKKTGAPPLPNVSTIPSNAPPLPARNDPPSLPPRNQLVSSQSSQRLNAPASFPPPATAAPPPPAGPPPPLNMGPPSPASPPPYNPGASIGAKDVNRLKPVKPPKKDISTGGGGGSGGGGGIDMRTIQQEALKKRGHINLEALENRSKKEDSNSNVQTPPPWAGQLKRRKPVDTVSNTSAEDKEEENLAPWVRSKRGSFSEDAPAWVRKRLDSQNGAPPPVAKKPIKEKISEEPTVNGSIDGMHVHKPPPITPKPFPKPPHLLPKSLNNNSGTPPVRPKPPVPHKSVSPKPSPTFPSKHNHIESHMEETEKAFSHTLPKVGVHKKVPPPKPPRNDIPFSPTDVENRLAYNEGSNVSDLGPPKFTPKLPISPSFAQAKETNKPPAIPKRMPPPSIPPPPPPSEEPVEPVSFSPPKYPAPLPPNNPPLPPPPPKDPVPPPVTSTPPPLPPMRHTPALPPHVLQPKRYRRRFIPPHDAYTPPGVPDRATKPGRSVASVPTPVPPMLSRPQIQSHVTGAPVLPQKPPPLTAPQKIPPPPPPLEPEEFECDDFYDDVDTVKKAMPSANVRNSPNVATPVISK